MVWMLVRFGWVRERRIGSLRPFWRGSLEMEISLFGPLCGFDVLSDDGIGEWDLIDIVPPNGVITSPDTGPKDFDPRSKPMESNPKLEPLESSLETNSDMPDLRTPLRYHGDD